MKNTWEIVKKSNKKDKTNNNRIVKIFNLLKPILLSILIQTNSDKILDH